MVEDHEVIAHVVNVVILERVSKKGNRYKAMYAQDENGKVYFICYVK